MTVGVGSAPPLERLGVPWGYRQSGPSPIASNGVPLGPDFDSRRLHKQGYVRLGLQPVARMF
jgi:hypothetical protein